MCVVVIDRNWRQHHLDVPDPWDDPPAYVFIMRPVEAAPDTTAVLTIGFEAGVPASLDGRRLESFRWCAS